MQGIAVILGNYKATRIVDQLQHGYTRVLVNPILSDVLAERKQQARREGVARFVRSEPLLLVFTKPLADRQQRRDLLFHSRHWRMHALFLAETAWAPDERANVDELLLFPEDGVLPASNRWIPHHLAETEWAPYGVLPASNRWIPHHRELLPSRLGEGECVWIKWGRTTQVEVFRPWPRRWTPETHWSFDRATRARIWQLLLGQRDAGSPLHRLDHNCMLHLLQWTV
jgi:hypothetical protein